MTTPTSPAILGSLFFLAGCIAAEAAPSAVTTKVADAASRIHPTAAIERTDDSACSRARRRLWIEGEGWIVRRITTCR